MMTEQEEAFHPRWGRVYAKGPKMMTTTPVREWILVEHGRWTRGCKIITEKKN